tara:strand:- start:347 stop:541 length:195 start_codon:yes stop_codon:yes gene_type:complete
MRQTTIESDMRERQQERREELLILLISWGCLDGLTDSEKKRIYNDLEWLTESAINDFKQEINKI